MSENAIKQLIAIVTLIAAGLVGVGVTNKDILLPKDEAAPTRPAEESGNIVVNIPETCDVGQLMVFDTAGSTADKFDWKILPPTDNFMVIDGGLRAIFSGDKPGTYTIIVAGKYGEEVEVTYRVLDIGGAKDVVVDPDVVAPSSTLASRIVEMLKQAGATKEDARVLERSFNSVLLGMQAGILTTPESIVTAQKTAIGLAFRTNLPKWANFKEQLRLELNSLRDQGRLSDLNGHKLVWAEIIEGLRAYGA